MATRQDSTLTRREQEVAPLVAQGLTNRQIAERLFISERTAEHHVEQIRSKLGFHSRSQIAAWVAGSPPSADRVPAVQAAESTKTLSGQPSAAWLTRRRRWVIAVAISLGVATVLVGLAFVLTRAAPLSLTVVTIAGTGQQAFSADGRSATATDLVRPSALAVDAGGALYFIDGNRVRMITRQRTVKTVAGTGEPGNEGDGGPAVLAKFNSPSGLAIDPTGNIFIADTGNNRVREINADGTIVPVAGTGEAGFFGDGGQALQARLNSPAGLAIGFGGTLYIADTLNQRVRQVTSDGVITTVAGTGNAGYTYDGVPATAAQLNLPEGLAFDNGKGNLFIDDTANSRVRKLDLSGAISTVAGTGVQGFSVDTGRASDAELNPATEGFSSGQALAVDTEGNLYVADAANEKIRKVDLHGNISTIAGTGQAGYSGDGKPATGAVFNVPLSVAIDAQGVLYVADSGNSRIRAITTQR